MIITFGDARTERLFHGDVVKGLSHPLQRSALRKLMMLDAADNLHDLTRPPGNRLQALHGTLEGFHSIRVNDQWRICFRWRLGHATDVHLIDYH
ncbi:MAG: type II toxin-antitoxin system RelE/ParE family toxin [Proteobacteria bacterium]|nr:type II toxin-antitoxin system RelE/ParE family toxin [Pseudomonadota bacterium]